jgi:hypothetical protein
MTSGSIEFPFERARLHRIHELKAFEAELLVTRQRDLKLDRMLRDPRGRAPGWIRLRNKELVPLKLFADHTGLSDGDQFLLRPEGDPIDAQVVTGDGTLSLQFTLAAPSWQNSGHQHHQVMRALNESDCVVGYPPYTSENGVAIGAVTCITTDDRRAACHTGLVSAITNKASFDGHGCILAVYAQDFYMQLLEAYLFRALVDAVMEQHRLSFDATCVFDNQPGFFVERTRPLAS